MDTTKTQRKLRKDTLVTQVISRCVMDWKAVNIYLIMEVTQMFNYLKEKIHNKELEILNRIGAPTKAEEDFLFWCSELWHYGNECILQAAKAYQSIK